MHESTRPIVSGTAALQREVSELIIESLNLEITVDQIQPDDTLFGDGLGLDSIDVLEIALAVSVRYGIQLRADNADNREIFTSVRSLTGYIAAQRTA